MSTVLPRLPEPRAAAASGDALADVLALAEADAEALADRLHDGALQALVVARYAADAAVRGGDAAAARDAVQEALVALRRAVWHIRPRGARGLAAALRDLSGSLETAGAPPLDLELDPAADDAVAPAAAAVAYRLVQRCSAATPRLAVRVVRTPDDVVVDVGAAVTDAAAEALRARAVGGTLLALAEGTRLTLPLDRPLPEDLP